MPPFGDNLPQEPSLHNAREKKKDRTIVDIYIINYWYFLQEKLLIPNEKKISKSNVGLLT